MRRARFALVLSLVACGGGPGGGGPSNHDAGGPHADASVDDDAATGPDAGDAGDLPLTFCEEPTTLLYDPPASRDTIPDDVFTRDDPSAVTGLRISFAAALDVRAPAEVPWYEEAETLDGWGITAPLVLRFSDRLDPASLPASPRTAPAWSDAVVLVDLGDEPALVPIALALVAEDAGSSVTNLVVTPHVPLRPRTLHGLAVTGALRDAAGRCVAPSATLRGRLEGSDAFFERVRPGMDRLLDALASHDAITTAGELTSLTTFTTQHTVEEDVELAALVEGLHPEYEPEGCEPGAGDYLVCEGTLRVADFRQQGRWIDPDDLTVQDHSDVPVTVYRPTAGDEPFTTVLFGHGLGGTRTDAESLAEVFAANGWAIVGIDAVKHGDHPDDPPLALQFAPGIVPSVYAFFGMGVPVRLDGLFDPLAQRDNWRESQLERLQLVQAVRDGMDADGDGTRDLDTETLFYFGASMGGIMAAEPAALVPEIDAVVSVVPGARVGGIISEGVFFEAAMVYLRTRQVEGQLQRWFALWQTIIDGGDSAVWTPHAVRDRLPGMTPSPQFLIQMVQDDLIVPNTSNTLYARSVGVPHLGEVLFPIDLVELEPALPTSGNVAATVTGGSFQYDVIYVADGPETQRADHSGLSRNPVALEQTVHFFRTFEETGTAEILDPYETLGIE